MARGLPPWALEGAVGATSPVERVEGWHVLVREGEVEDLGVFFDAFEMRRLGDHYQVALQAPTEYHLRRSASDGCRDAPHCLVREVAAGPKRTVSLDDDIPLLCSLEQ